MPKPDLDAAFASVMPPGMSKRREPATEFPGGKAPRNIQQRKDKHEPTEWDANPKTLVLDGEEVEFFLIGHLALALDRRPVAMRKWETNGILPEALWRSAAPAGPQAQGSTAGRRLYSRNQIEMIIMAGRLFHIDDRRKADWQAFAKFLHENWTSIG